MLLPRVLTAFIGIPILLFLIHWGGLSFSLFIVALAALSLYEYGLILTLGGRSPQRVVVILAGAGLAAGQALGAPLGAIVAAATALVMLREMASAEHSLERVALTVFGAVLFGWMPAHLASIRDLRPNGEKLTLMLFVSVWAMDTAAFAIGKTFGRHRLAPALSPKKSWEGFVAGFVAAAACVFAFRAATPGLLSLFGAATLAVAIGVGGQLSDLTESLIKRAVGAKDSGALLPGHGGVMDRFDSFVLCAPAVYYCLLFL